VQEMVHGWDGTRAEQLSVRIVALSGWSGRMGTLRAAAGVGVGGGPGDKGVGTLRAEAGAGVGWGPVGTGGGGTRGSTLRAAAGRSWVGCAVPWRMSMRSLRAWAWLLVSGAKGELGDGLLRAWTMSVMPARM